MSGTDGGSVVGRGDTLASAAAEGYRASGHSCRVVDHGVDTYVRVRGEGTDALVWVRDRANESDKGFSRSVLECERYVGTERHVLGTGDRDPVASHALSLALLAAGVVV